MALQLFFEVLDHCQKIEGILVIIIKLFLAIICKVKLTNYPYSI